MGVGTPVVGWSATRGGASLPEAFLVEQYGVDSRRLEHHGAQAAVAHREGIVFPHRALQLAGFLALAHILSQIVFRLTVLGGTLCTRIVNLRLHSADALGHGDFYGAVIPHGEMVVCLGQF